MCGVSVWFVCGHEQATVRLHGFATCLVFLGFTVYPVYGLLIAVGLFCEGCPLLTQDTLARPSLCRSPGWTQPGLRHHRWFAYLPLLGTVLVAAAVHLLRWLLGYDLAKTFQDLSEFRIQACKGGLEGFCRSSAIQGSFSTCCKVGSNK